LVLPVSLFIYFKVLIIDLFFFFSKTSGKVLIVDLSFSKTSGKILIVDLFFSVLVSLFFSIVFVP
jgi:hypothetical protein